MEFYNTETIVIVIVGTIVVIVLAIIQARKDKRDYEESFKSSNKRRRELE